MLITTAKFEDPQKKREQFAVNLRNKARADKISKKRKKQANRNEMK